MSENIRDEKFESLQPSDSFRRLDFDNARVVPGIVNETYILIVSGEKPYLNMVVALVPFVYVKQPEYWGFEIVGSIPGGIGLPTLAKYTAHKDLSGVTGTKGIEVFGTDYSLKIAVPPSFEHQMEVSKNKTKGKAQLCNKRGDVEYRANQVRETVFLIATGTHGTPGYDVFFEQALIDVFPPQFILKHIAPGGITIQLETPFVAITQFSASDKIEELTVHDAQGARQVPVDQTPD